MHVFSFSDIKVMKTKITLVIQSISANKASGQVNGTGISFGCGTSTKHTHMNG